MVPPQATEWLDAAAPDALPRREVYDRFSAYDTIYRIAADYEAILRWLGKGVVTPAYIPEVPGENAGRR